MRVHRSAHAHLQVEGVFGAVVGMQPQAWSLFRPIFHGSVQERWGSAGKVGEFPERLLAGAGQWGCGALVSVAAAPPHHSTTCEPSPSLGCSRRHVWGTDGGWCARTLSPSFPQPTFAAGWIWALM